MGGMPPNICSGNIDTVVAAKFLSLLSGQTAKAWRTSSVLRGGETGGFRGVCLTGEGEGK